MIFTIFFIFFVVLALFFSIKIAVSDFRRRIIPDIYLFGLLFIGLIIVENFTWICSIQNGIFTGATTYLITCGLGWLFDKLKKTDLTSIGFGDIKLLSVCGIWLGSYGLAISLIIACVLAGIWAKKHHQQYVPLAPFLLSGAIIALIILFVFPKPFLMV